MYAWVRERNDNRDQGLKKDQTKRDLVSTDDKSSPRSEENGLTIKE